MKRRHFLGATAAAVAASTWPELIRQAFGDTPACETGPAAAKGADAQLAEVASAFRRAQQAKRPLLVFVIPAKDDEKWDRGQIFGELLNHGTDKDLAPLADVDVVCATMADLKKIVPSAGEGEPLMVLVPTNKVPAVAVQLNPTVPPYDASMDDWDEQRKQEERIAKSRIDAVAASLRSALGSDARKVAARAAAARARLTKKAPAGAHWANSHGCGTTIEGVEDNMAIGCGMGHVPAKSSRFLYFFSVDRGPI